MKKLRILLAGLFVFAVFGAAPGRAAAAEAPITYVFNLQPGDYRDFGRYGCTVRFSYATRINSEAVAKIRRVSGNCGSNTRVRVKVSGDLGARCYLNTTPASTCYEYPWSASKWAGRQAQGGLISICQSDNSNCAPYDIIRP